MVEDGSTDGSPTVIEQLAAADPRVRHAHQPHQGIVPALQRAIASAKGEFLARMDADDVCTPDRLQKQVEYLLAHPDCVALGARALQVTVEGWPVSIWLTPLEHAEIVERYFQPGVGIVHPTAVYRASAVHEVGGYEC